MRRVRTPGLHCNVAASRTAMIAAAALIAAAVPAWAQEQQRQAFNIQRQSTAAALNEFARQAGVQILFPFDAASRTNSSGLEGVYSRGDALNQLIRGTQLQLASDDGRTIVLRSNPNAAQVGAANQAASRGAGGYAHSSIDEIVVPGERLQTLALEYISAAAMASPASDQYSRWSASLCPSVAGLAPDAAQTLIDRIARRAHDIGLETQQTGCQPNLVIIFAPDPNRLAREIVETRRDLLGYYDGDDAITAGRGALEEFADRPRAVRWWHVSRTVGADGQAVAEPRPGSSGMASRNYAQSVTGTVGLGLETATVGEFQGAGAVRSQGTRMRRDTRQDLSFALVIIDSSRAADAAPEALADYLSMTALVEINPDADMRPFPSILNLFAETSNNQTAPRAMTDWDIAYLQAFYRSARDAASLRQQNSEIARRMAELVREDGAQENRR